MAVIGDDGSFGVSLNTMQVSKDILAVVSVQEGVAGFVIRLWRNGCVLYFVGSERPLLRLGVIKTRITGRLICKLGISTFCRVAGYIVCTRNGWSYSWRYSLAGRGAITRLDSRERTISVKAIPPPSMRIRPIMSSKTVGLIFFIIISLLKTKEG